MRTIPLAALPALLLAACDGGLAKPGSTDPAFEAGAPAVTDVLRDSLWDDGQAEIAAYRVVQRKYGELREGEATLIVVKEEVDADSLVKADGPRHPRTLTAMKLSHVLTVPTGVYTYRQMASVWLTRAEGRPIKLAVGSQEWCGLTSKVMTIRGGEALLRTHSYFGAEGERVYGVPIDDVTVLADALPLWVRTLDLDDHHERTLRVVDEQLSNHATAPEVRRATVQVGAAQPVEVPAGRFDAVPVTVTRREQVEQLWLDAEPPHTLVRWDRADGGQYALEWVRRAPYWSMNRPEDVGALDPERGPAEAGALEPETPEPEAAVTR